MSVLIPTETDPFRRRNSYLALFEKLSNSLALPSEGVADATARTENVRIVIVAGLMDIWSEIRKTTANYLSSVADKLGLLQLGRITSCLVEILQSTRSTWQAKEGAVMGLCCVLKGFKWDRMGLMKVGRVTLERLPEFITDYVPGILYEMLEHPQLSIRENTTKVFAVFLARSSIEVSMHELSQIIQRLLPATAAAGPAAPVVEAFAAEGLLSVAVIIFKALPPMCVFPELGLYLDIFERYLQHEASTVRQEASTLYRVLATKDPRNPIFTRRVLAWLVRSWTPDKSWRWLEGRYLAFDLILNALLSDHQNYIHAFPSPKRAAQSPISFNAPAMYQYLHRQPSSPMLSRAGFNSEDRRSTGGSAKDFVPSSGSNASDSTNNNTNSNANASANANTTAVVFDHSTPPQPSNNNNGNQPQTPGAADGPQHVARIQSSGSVASQGSAGGNTRGATGHTHAHTPIRTVSSNSIFPGGLTVQTGNNNDIDLGSSQGHLPAFTLLTPVGHQPSHNSPSTSAQQQQLGTSAGSTLAVPPHGYPQPPTPQGHGHGHPHQMSLLDMLRGDPELDYDIDPYPERDPQFKREIAAHADFFRELLARSGGGGTLSKSTSIDDIAARSQSNRPAVTVAANAPVEQILELLLNETAALTKSHRFEIRRITQQFLPALTSVTLFLDRDVLFAQWHTRLFDNAPIDDASTLALLTTVKYAIRMIQVLNPAEQQGGLAAAVSGGYTIPTASSSGSSLFSPILHGPHFSHLHPPLAGAAGAATAGTGSPSASAAAGAVNSPSSVSSPTTATSAAGNAGAQKTKSSPTGGGGGGGTPSTPGPGSTTGGIAGASTTTGGGAGGGAGSSTSVLVMSQSSIMIDEGIRAQIPRVAEVLLEKFLLPSVPREVFLISFELLMNIQAGFAFMFPAERRRLHCKLVVDKLVSVHASASSKEEEREIVSVVHSIIPMFILTCTFGEMKTMVPLLLHYIRSRDEVEVHHSVLEALTRIFLVPMNRLPASAAVAQMIMSPRLSRQSPRPSPDNALSSGRRGRVNSIQQKDAVVFMESESGPEVLGDVASVAALCAESLIDILDQKLEISVLRRILGVLSSLTGLAGDLRYVRILVRFVHTRIEPFLSRTRSKHNSVADNAAYAALFATPPRIPFGGSLDDLNVRASAGGAGHGGSGNGGGSGAANDDGDDDLVDRNHGGADDDDAEDEVDNMTSALMSRSAAEWDDSNWDSWDDEEDTDSPMDAIAQELSNFVSSIEDEFGTSPVSPGESSVLSRSGGASAKTRETMGFRAADHTNFFEFARTLDEGSKKALAFLHTYPRKT